MMRRPPGTKRTDTLLPYPTLFRSGFMKAVADADSGQILGAAILGVEGDEAIHGILDAINAGIPYATLQWAVPIHPTVSELIRSEEHTSELQSLMRISYAVFCLKKKKVNATVQDTCGVCLCFY